MVSCASTSPSKRASNCSVSQRAPDAARISAPRERAALVSAAACSKTGDGQIPIRNFSIGGGAREVSTIWNSSATAARSAIERAYQPIVSNDSEASFAPSRLTDPQLGFRAKMPQNEAGRINDPPVCVPNASGTWKSATAAADPLDEPLGGRLRSCGLGVGAVPPPPA